MFIVKAHLGDGEWSLWEAEFDLSYLGHNCAIEVPAISEADRRQEALTTGGILDHDYWGDERFPGSDGDQDAILHVHYQPDNPENPPRSTRFMRWVRWYTSPHTHVLITDGPVYICNAQGDTIEALR